MTQELNKRERDLIINLIAEEVASRQKLRTLIWRQFFVGVAYGLGASLGAAVILGSIVYVYRNFLDFLLNTIVK